MASEEEIKKRLLQQKLQEHAAFSAQAQQQASQAREMEDALKMAMTQILDNKARERLSNLKLVKPDVAMQLQMYLVQMFQAGQITQKITDEQLVVILRKLTEKRETKIRRK